MIADRGHAGKAEDLPGDDVFGELCPISQAQACALAGPGWQCVGLDMHLRAEGLVVRYRFRPAWASAPVTPAFLGWTP